MWTRRQFVSRSALGLLGAGGICLALPGAGPGAASDDAREALPDGSASKDMVTPRADQSIDRALAYLANRRSPTGCFGTGVYAGNVAVTSLGALAFMAAGNQPDRGLYGRLVMDALRFVLGQENRPPGGRPGFLHNPSDISHGPMYGHGFGTLFLAEVSGMVHEPVLREELDGKLHRAVKLILGSQNSEGGWRYDPEPRPAPHDADISVTICQIMALRAARNSGLAVPKSQVDRCVQYVKDCQERNAGYFRYQKQGGGRTDSEAYARTAAGVVALNSAGFYVNTDASEIPDKTEQAKTMDSVARIKTGLEFLRRNRPLGLAVGPFGRPGPGLDMHYFYGHYYAVQAMWAAGGDYWKEYFPAIREELIGRQLADGSWFDGICSHYATAMACIILQIPNNYLPILQR